MANLTERHEELAAESKWDFSDLSALFINCTLKRSPEPSNTRGLADLAVAIMERNGVSVEVIRAVDHQIATGVYPDMTEHGWERDDWPAIFEKVIAADILVVLSPIWLGEKSSVCTQVIERLYGNSHLLNDAGQWAYYGRVGGCMITGNEDGAKHCAMNILYSLQHLGYVIPPQADSGWLGEAGPGPSYLDPGSGGPENDFTNRNTTFLAWNLMHSRGCSRTLAAFPRTATRRACGTRAAASTSPTPTTAERRPRRPTTAHSTARCIPGCSPGNDRTRLAGSCSALVEVGGGWCEEGDSFPGVELGVVSEGNALVSVGKGDDEASGWPGDVVDATAERGRSGVDGDLDDFVAGEWCAGRVGERCGVGDCEVGCDRAALDLADGGAHVLVECLEHVAAGDPALEALPGHVRSPVTRGRRIG